MRRRSWLKLGVAGGALFALGGVTLALWRDGWAGSRLTREGRALFGAVARALLDGTLPDAQSAPAEHRGALDAHLQRLEAVVAGMPGAVQAEVAELTSLLLHPAGRYMITGLDTGWAAADTAELQATMQRLRESRLELRQQVFHALRELTNAAYFSDATAWKAMGYPGPRAMPAA